MPYFSITSHGNIDTITTTAPTPITSQVSLHIGIPLPIVSSVPLHSNVLVDTIRSEIASALAGLLPQNTHNGDSLVTSSSSESAVPRHNMVSDATQIFSAISPQQHTVGNATNHSNLPAIPASILEKIRRGEFVNFDSLLPNNVPSESNNLFTMSLDQSNSSVGPRILVQNSSNNRNKVTDLYTWVLAWSLFFQACIIFRGHLVAQLLKYQIFIAQLASQYNFQAWYAYDQAFRVFMSNNPHCNWDQCNDDIFNLHIRGAQGRSRCFSCGGRDHFANACPTKRYATTNYY